MNAFPKRKSFGFSLIELLVGIVIVGILLTLAMPSFQEMLRNSEIRNAAESITTGLQRARAEAVARNTNVEFVLGAGSSWEVRVVSAPNPPIDKRSSNEGSPNVTRTALAADLPPAVPPTFNDLTPATSITFNNFGGIVANADASATLAQVDLAAAGGKQNLRVTIGVGGSARMCDPNLAPGSSPRAC